MTRPLCIGLPPEWWDTGDDGNRLALLICNQCRVADWCARRITQPDGVIVAGVAYADHNGQRRPLPVCACGYPNDRQRPGNPMCRRCDPVAPVIRLPKVGKVRPRQPCGTNAAAVRHRYYKEPLDAACVEAERAWGRTRKRATRARKVAA